MPLALIGLGTAWWQVAMGFAMFRLFDIWKPSPIRDAQDFSGGIGIVLDDLLAATAACVTSHGIVWLVSWMKHLSA
jgi:phosphatidylglycerophosphatase A